MPPYFFDIWSIGHVALWGVLGFFLMKGLSRSRSASRSSTAMDMWLCLGYGLVIGIAWETFEWKVVEPLLGFHEAWYNRWVSDPCCDLAGTLVGACAALDVEDT